MIRALLSRARSLGGLRAATPVGRRRRPGAPPSTSSPQGQPVGSETVTVLVTDDGWKVMSTGPIAAPVAAQHPASPRSSTTAPGIRAALLVDALVKGKASMVKTTFTGTAGGQRHRPGRAPLPEDRHRRRADDRAAEPDLRQLRGARGAPVDGGAAGATFRVYVAPQAEITVTLGAVSTERVSAPGRTFEARKHALTFANPGGPLAVDLWTDGPRLMRISIPSVGLEVIRDDVATVAGAHVEPLSRQRRRRLDRRRAYGFNLAGTLSKPADAAPTARLPAIVLIAGSGPLDRDETAYGIPIFAQLANAFADAGFAVVRYDKRGVGQSGGRSEFATLGDYAEDVGRGGQVPREAQGHRPEAHRAGRPQRRRRGGAARGAARRARSTPSRSSPASARPGAQLILEQQQHALQVAARSRRRSRPRRSSCRRRCRPRC